MRTDGRMDPAKIGGPGAAVGDTLVWDGMRWVPGAASGISLHVGTSAPANTTTHPLWWDTDANSTAIADDFNRANSASLGSTSTGNVAWQELLGAGHSIGIVSNKATKNASDGNTVWAVDSAADGTVGTTVVTAGGYAGLILRATDWDNCHMFYKNLANDQFIYQRRIAGVTSGTTFLSSDNSGTYDIEAVMSGSTIDLYVNGVGVDSRTETHNQTATMHGLYAYTASATFDDFAAPTITAGAFKVWDGSAWQTVGP